MAMNSARRVLTFLGATLVAFSAPAATPTTPATPALPAAAGAAAAHQHIQYTQAGKHVTVWYYQPAPATPDTPVVVVMHGVGRNGEDYLADWIPFAQARTFLLVVPEFSKAEFPGDEGYNYGNMVDKAGHFLPRDQWSFSMIEPAVAAVREHTGNRTQTYRMYGHSAGAQFAQRFIYFVPAAHLSRVVVANAGWYMLPDMTTAFPYGLKDTPATKGDLRHALSLPVVVLLGTADVDPKAKALRHTPEAEAQGAYRFARGHYFFAHAEAAAHALNVPFVWRLATAPNIAHSDPGMAPFAAEQLFNP